MRNKKFLLFVVVAVLLAALSVSAASAQDTVTIHWWHIQTGDPGLSFWQSLADAYTKDHPNVKFEITPIANEDFKTNLATAMQAGNPPDLFQSWGGGVLWAYAAAGLTRNIAPELEANNNEWKDSFAAQSALELYGQNGAYYGVPWDWGAVGMFYNKALFTKAGLDPAKPPATWDDLITDIKALQKAGITPIAIGEKDRWPGHFWYAYLATREGGQDAFLKAYNRTGSFADPPFVKAFQDLKQLADLNAFQDGYLAATESDQEAAFGNGQAAMELMGQWAPSSQKSNSTSGNGIGDDLGWFPFPSIAGGAGKPTDVFGGGDGFAVGKDAPDAAVDFLKFLTSSANQIAGADPAVGLTVPPTVKGTDSVIANDPILSAIVAARNNATYFQLYYDQFLPQGLANAVLDNVQAVLAGSETPEDAAAALEAEAANDLTPATPSS